jgi:type II secretory pathway pseudopilin PulG
MTISSTRSDPRGLPAGTGAASTRRRSRRAFTLPEIMIGASLGTIVLTGVMAVFLMLGRTGMNAANYSMSEAEIRRALEAFAQDARMASNLQWNSDASITLTVPSNYADHGNQVTYAYDSADETFYRQPGGTSSTAARATFIRSVSSLTFARYNRLDAATTTDAETKRIRVTLNVRRTGRTLVAANTTIVSASYLLRNKVAI